MRKIIIFLVLAIVLISALPTIVFAAPPGGSAPALDFSTEQILVRFKPGTSLPEAAQVHRQLGGQVKETIPVIGVQVVTVPKGQMIAKANAYSSNGRVAYAEPDFVAEAVGSPDDQWFEKQWGMIKIQAPMAWEVTTGSTNINIAILDTGVDLDHPDLADKIVSNMNFSSSPTVDDVYGHGTHVAGIAAAMTDNGVGVAGLGYSSTIMNVKVLGDTGSGAYSSIASGIIWAVDNGAEIINMSLGGSSPSSTLENAINYAWSKGVVVVAAAGNYGNIVPLYPAYYTNCIAVAATDSLDRLASWSNYGEWVDVAAPGVGIYATLRNSGYGYKSGTSMASPHVAGLAALVYTTVSDTNGDGNLNDEVRSRIETNCDDVSIPGIGSGRINAARAVGDVVPVPPGSISGQVTDSEDGSAIAEATVSDGTRTTTTDASGEYTIADVPAGDYEITSSKEGYHSSSLTVTVLSGNSAVADLSMTEVIVPGSIKGTVMDAEDGLAIAGATVSDGTRMVTTDASGEYTIADVTPGTYEVTASKSDYEISMSTLTVVSGGTAVMNFSLNPQPVPINVMWVESIRFVVCGKNLFVEVSIATASGAVVGADVSLGMVCSTGELWNFSGTTNTVGLVKFKLGKAPVGSYMTTVTSLTCSGFTWDTTKGITTGSYTLSG